MSNWNTFTAAPHRMMMFGGTLQLVLAIVYWTAALAVHYTGVGLPLETVLPGNFAHGYLMLYGLFPYFIFGFLMTTYPRWMNGPLVERPRYIAAFLGMASGSVLVYIGLFTHAALLGLGVLIHACGWGIGLLELYRVFRAAGNPMKTHERYLNGYLLLGGLGMLSYAAGVLLHAPLAMRVALTLGLWGFVLPVMITVAHRMLPFFSSNVIQPYTLYSPLWMLPVLPLLIAGHVLCEYAGLWQWRFLFDLPLAALALWLSWRWDLRRSFQARLLAILHMAFLWFGIGMALYTSESLLLLGGSALSLGRAPLHALGIGLIAGMSLAMASRVTLGHSGRALVADGLVWACCWGLHLSALLRVLGDLPMTSERLILPSYLFAALIWLISVIPWAARFAPIYLRPRVDGRPG
ncbi:MAG: NnrS family protein [Gammaproteobacteria bacterium]|nr:NnrS family protein [Gammaproteobacteria bacterium]